MTSSNGRRNTGHGKFYPGYKMWEWSMCRNCHHTVPPGAAYCCNCGARIRHPVCTADWRTTPVDPPGATGNATDLMDKEDRNGSKKES